MTIEQVISVIQTLSDKEQVSIPADITCHASQFLHKNEAIEQLYKLDSYWMGKGLDTEYSMAPLGNQRAWNDKTLEYEIVECYSVTAINDFILKAYFEVQNSNWAKD